MVPLSDFYALPELSESFPIRYESGGVWNHLEGLCGRCRQRFDTQNLRGTVQQVFRDIYVLDSWGYCPGCDLLTPIKYRLYPDGMSGRSPKTGDWVHWNATRQQGLWGRLCQLLGF